MPTIFTHALLPVAAAYAVGPRRILPRLIAAGAIAAILPDADIIARYFHIPHTHDFGHRGATHTVAFALLVGLAGAWFSTSLRSGPWLAFLFLFLATLSHPLTDMLTDGGKGIMLFWPLEDVRMKFLATPVEVSPVGLRGFETGRIWPVLLSEAMWLILPAALLAIFARLAAKSLGRTSDSH